MKNKRGQFYLIAALVIIGVLMGLAAIYTKAETLPQDTIVYDLSKEINYEGGSVIDTGVFFAINEEEQNERIENLTDYYSAQNLGTDFTVIYGDREKMFVIAYITQDSGSVGINLGSIPAQNNFTSTGKYNTTFVPGSENTVTILIDQTIQHTFTIKPGQTFFIILKKEKQGERYVAASQPSD